MDFLKALLTRGYFPRELPPPFNTLSFGRAVAGPADNLHKVFSSNTDKRPIRHSLVRTGLQRRTLRIPHPVPYLNLCRAVSENWKYLKEFVHASDLSRSTPMQYGRGRALVPSPLGQHGLPAYRALQRAGFRAILRTDVARFYDSIYTHAIPWALHTKEVSKLQRKPGDNIGNLLDASLRRCQDGQSVGIPIGPDASFLVAEVILTAVDRRLGSVRGFRFLDDYELVFPARAAAEECLAQIQSILADFELAVNDKKTVIMELPVPHEEDWVGEIRTFRAKAEYVREGELISLFDNAFRLSVRYPDRPVLRYTMGLTNNLKVEKRAWPMLQALQIQAATAEPAVIYQAIGRCMDSRRLGYRVNLEMLEESLNMMIGRLATLGFANEVSWAVWALLVFRLPPTAEILLKLSEMDDPIVALLCLYAKNEVGGAWEQLSEEGWAKSITKEESNSDRWLLVYEALAQRWLPPVRGNPLKDEPYLRELHEKGVRFFDPSKFQSVRQVRIAPSRGLAPMFSAFF